LIIALPPPVLLDEREERERHLQPEYTEIMILKRSDPSRDALCMDIVPDPERTAEGTTIHTTLHFLII
jgi:hypothetical protein